MDTKELLLKYNKYTLEAIQAIKKDEDIEEFVEKRDGIVETLKTIYFDKELGNELARELEIVKNEKILLELMIKKKGEIKKEIDLIKKRRMARQNYSNLSSKPNFFNKKV